MTLLDILAQPFNFTFLQNAFLIGGLIAVPTALLSCFLVLKGWALMGDAVSHATLPGIVLAWMLNLPLALGAFLMGLGCALLTGYISNNSRVKEDTVLGIVFSGMFAVGIILYTSITTDMHLDHILFGNVLGVSLTDIYTSGAISLGVTVLLVLKWKDFMLYTFDLTQAQACGLNIKFLHYALLCSLAVMIVATLSAAGVILAIALLITPGAIAFLLVQNFARMLILAVVICMLSMLGGIYISFFIDSAPAPTVVLILTVVFILVFGAKILRATSFRSL